MDQIKSKQCHFDVNRFSASLMKKPAAVDINAATCKLTAARSEWVISKKLLLEGVR
jgi:hypothetical protein